MNVWSWTLMNKSNKFVANFNKNNFTFVENFYKNIFIFEKIITRKPLKESSCFPLEYHELKTSYFQLHVIVHIYI